jgi:hypothetical protein
MRDFTTDELSRMQTAQQNAMQDTCVILTRTAGAADAYGYPAETWSAATTTACGIDEHAQDEAMGDGEVVMVDAVIRLPIALDGTFDGSDRVQVTHRFGVALDAAVTYEIMGNPERGPSGLVLNLQKVTDGSDA